MPDHLPLMNLFCFAEEIQRKLLLSRGSCPTGREMGLHFIVSTEILKIVFFTCLHFSLKTQMGLHFIVSTETLKSVFTFCCEQSIKTHMGLHLIVSIESLKSIFFTFTVNIQLKPRRGSIL